MLYTAFLTKLQNLLVTVKVDPAVKHHLFLFTDGDVSSPFLSLYITPFLYIDFLRLAPPRRLKTHTCLSHSNPPLIASPTRVL